MSRFKVKLRYTDRRYSDYIRIRDGWICQRCGRDFSEKKGSLENSHYWGRWHENTRFDNENCIALCKYCHDLWGHGEGHEDYTAHMIKLLGQDGFDKLRLKSNIFKKQDDKADLIIIKEMLKEMSMTINKMSETPV